MSERLLDLVRPELRPLTAYVTPAEHGAIKLDANESPWPLPEDARQLVARTLASVDLHRYPDPRATELRRKLAERTLGHPDDLVIGSGSDEVIALLMTALTAPRGERQRAAVLFPDPTFVMFRITALAHGLAPVAVPLDARFQLDVDAMRAAIETHTPNLVLLATPNNPTGNAFRDEDLRVLIESDPAALFVIDEAYGPFAGRTLASWCDQYDNVALLGTLSKVGLAAARVGWCRLPRALATEVDKARQPYNLNALSQAVALLALDELAGVLDEHVRRVVAERTRLLAALAKRPGLVTHPSDANFVLVRHEGAIGTLAAALESDGIAVKHWASGPLAGHARITVGTPAENDRLLEALDRALSR